MHNVHAVQVRHCLRDIRSDAQRVAQVALAQMRLQARRLQKALGSHRILHRAAHTLNAPRVCQWLAAQQITENAQKHVSDRLMGLQQQCLC